MTKGPTTRFKVEVLDGDRTSRREDVVTTEEPLELRLEWPGRPPEPLVVTMRTPGSDFELAAGFCLTEGVADADSIDTIAYCLGGAGEQLYNVVTVRFRRPVAPDVLTRRFLANSSCGICGKAALDEIET